MHTLCLPVVAEDADSAINTKEIISSIVTAANKKLKLRQQNKSTDSLDFGSTLSQHSIDSTVAATTTTTTTAALSQCTGEVGDGRYQERSVDAAVSRAVAMTKSQTSLTSSLRYVGMFSSAAEPSHQPQTPLACSVRYVGMFSRAADHSHQNHRPPNISSLSYVGMFCSATEPSHQPQTPLASTLRYVSMFSSAAEPSHQPQTPCLVELPTTHSHQNHRPPTISSLRYDGMFS